MEKRKTPIIYTLSGEANCGKDYGAKVMKEYLESKGNKVLVLAYADFLKSICARNYGYDPQDKENGRKILQIFGTDVVRTCNDRIWVDTVWNFIDSISTIFDYFIITDARYENEIKPFPFVLSYPIFAIKIKTDEKFKTKLSKECYEHSSESLSHKDNTELFDFVITNNKDKGFEKGLHLIIDTIINVSVGYDIENEKDN